MSNFLYNKKSDHLLPALAVFICTFFIYSDLGIRMIYGWLLLTLILCVKLSMNFISNSCFEINKEKKAWFLIVFTLLCFFILPNSRKDEDTISYMIALIVVFLYYFVMNPSVEDFKICKKIFYFIAILFSAAIIFFKLNPQLYFEYIYPYLSEKTQALASYYIPRGYGIPIGGSFVYADYIIIFAIIFKLCDMKEKDKNILSYFEILFFLIAVVCMGRRGELLGAIVSTVVIYVISNKKSKVQKRILLLFLLFAIVLLCIILFYNQLKAIPVLHRYIITIEGVLKNEDTSSGRFELWEMAIKIFKTSPVMGIGYRRYSDFVSSEFRAIHGSDVQDVHNDFLQLLCEVGLVGTLFVVLGFIIIFLSTIKIIKISLKKKERAKYREVSSLGLVSLGIQIFYLILGLFDPVFFKIYFCCFYIIAAIATSLAKKIYYNIGSLGK